MDFVVHCRRSAHDVYIGRSSVWGNPFVIGRDGSREEVIQKFESWFTQQSHLVQRAKRELKGKVLGCWCTPHPCHGDVLVRIANESSSTAADNSA